MDRQLAHRYYCALMEEIKLRVEAAHTCLEKPILRPEFRFETAFLHFRMICETIALGCLVAHNDIPGTKSQWFRKSIDVPAMMKRMTELHASFYPRPCKRVIQPGGHHHITFPETPHLSKERLMKLYVRAGDILHRGSYRRVLEQKPKPREMDEAHRWHREILNLLDQHIINLRDEEKMLYVMMEPPNDHRTHAFLLERSGLWE